MNRQGRATVSNRWSPPTYDEADGHWTATLRAPLTSRELAVGSEAVAFGPTVEACIAETARIDAERERRLP